MRAPAPCGVGGQAEVGDVALRRPRGQRHGPRREHTGLRRLGGAAGRGPPHERTRSPHQGAVGHPLEGDRGQALGVVRERDVGVVLGVARAAEVSHEAVGGKAQVERALLGEPGAVGVPHGHEETRLPPGRARRCLPGEAGEERHGMVDGHGLGSHVRIVERDEEPGVGGHGETRRQQPLVLGPGRRRVPDRDEGDHQPHVAGQHEARALEKVVGAAVALVAELGPHRCAGEHRGQQHQPGHHRREASCHSARPPRPRSRRAAAISKASLT